MATAEVVKIKCPVCGKEGTQSFYSPKGRPDVLYMRVIHSHDEIHFIGRARSATEFEGEMNKPETKDEYEKAMKDISKQLRDLANYYSSSKSGSAVKFARSVQEILASYGY